ncbi:MAG: DUF975 family protein [Ruminococcaceae bacterium]|nr:DUF975 family protein [Oscillospiraceae bacterium]
MTPFDRQAVKETARQTLAHTESNHKKLVLIHTGAMLVLSFALMLIDLLLSQKISATGGLGGISTRSTLTTIQSALRLAELAVIPFWQAGYTYLTLRLSQNEPVSFKTLTEGFMRLGPVLRLLLLQLVLYLAAGFISVNISSTIFMATPWAQPLFDVADQMQQGVEYTNEMILAATADVTLPLMIITLVPYIGLAAFIFYRYRLAMYSLLDDEQTTALSALRNSRILTKGQRMQLFKLDVSFWWYYVCEVLVAALCFLDWILLSLGIVLPLPQAAITFLGFGLYAAAQLALHYWCKNEVNVTYAQVYNTLMEE